MADYSKMTDAEFDRLLTECLAEEPAGNILQIPGVYEAVSEYYNNEVLDRWAKENPRLAYPEDYEDEDDEVSSV